MRGHRFHREAEFDAVSAYYESCEKGLCKGYLQIEIAIEIEIGIGTRK